MRIGSGQNTYEWIEDWARVPETPSHGQNGRTHAAVVTEAGQVVVFCQPTRRCSSSMARAP
jgi:hypothetical protein